MQSEKQNELINAGLNVKNDKWLRTNSKRLKTNKKDVRITFHVWKYTVTIVIRETKRKAQSVKNNRHSGKE